MNPNCYHCKYRGEVPGDAHSMCHHPVVEQDSGLRAFGGLLAGKNLEAAIKLNIRADPHGVRRGWFYWPANYDPVWLDNCDGFTPREPVKT